MRPLPLVVVFGLAVVAVAGCSKETGSTAPTPPPVATPPPAAVPPVLTLAPDTTSSVGQAVGITYASRAQEPGKIAVAVTGYNLRNQLSSSVGFFGVVGVLNWDHALLEVDGAGVGDLLGGNTQANCCLWNAPNIPEGAYPFSVDRTDLALVAGSGELFLLRLRPRPDITAGTTRIELIPFVPNDPTVGFMPYVLLVPFRPPPATRVDSVYGATITIRPGS